VHVRTIAQLKTLNPRNGTLINPLANKAKIIR